MTVDFNRLIQTTQYHYGNTSIPYTISPPPGNYWPSNNFDLRVKEDDEMTTLNKVANERKEARERKRIEKVYDALDLLDLDGQAEGGVIRFDVTEPDGKVLTYAALHADDRWWATGATAPNGVGLEDLLAWMIRKNVILDSVVVL